jgi:crotonobetainyl-CoA:carnitine CoA-transferase CaiB-like acyl-CoA transferase
LAGIRVLEFSQLIMGPVTGLILADLGADVIKVEPAPAGDPTRDLKGFASGFFAHFNRNKRGVAINLKENAGRDVVRKLVAGADVLIENYAPGTMDRLGCGYPTLAELNPRLIYASLKGFLDGPYAHRAALDEVVQFMGGLAYMTGPAGRPLRAGTSVVDLMGGTMAAVAILAALRERDRTGQGQLVKSGLFESTVFMMGQHMAASALLDEPMEPMPEKRGGWGIYEPFPTADGERVFIAITSDNHWVRFCKAFELSDLLNDVRLATNSQRIAARPWMLPQIADTIARRRKADVLRLCDLANVPFAPVAKVEDLFDDHHLNESGALLQVPLREDVTAKLPRLPVAVGNHTLGLTRGSPRLGEHTTEILEEAGIDRGDRQRLARDGVIVCGDDGAACGGRSTKC